MGANGGEQPGACGTLFGSKPRGLHRRRHLFLGEKRVDGVSGVNVNGLTDDANVFINGGTLSVSSAVNVGTPILVGSQLGAFGALWLNSITRAPFLISPVLAETQA